MDDKEKAARAKAVLQDEILQLAVTETLDAFNSQMLNAKTPEEREAHWHEYHGLKRAYGRLKTWPHKA